MAGQVQVVPLPGCRRHAQRLVVDGDVEGRGVDGGHGVVWIVDIVAHARQDDVPAYRALLVSEKADSRQQAGQLADVAVEVVVIAVDGVDA